jgi:GTP-binding protein
MADIPGLIEGAHKGAGLGFEFLRHIERTTIIAHILDIMPADGTEPADNYKTIRKELKQYSKALARKKEIIIANKIDLDPKGEIVEKLKKKLKKKIYPISAVTGEGIKELTEILWKKVKQTKDIMTRKQ